MTENTTPEERIDLAAKARLEEIKENRLNEEALERVTTNKSLSTLGWISAIGFILAIIGYITVANAETIQTVTIWGGIVGTGVTVGFISLVAYLSVKAIINAK